MFTMKYFTRCLVGIGLLLHMNTQAQNFYIWPSSLNFGDVYETETDSLAVTLYNTSDHTATIQTMRFYSKYNYKAFSVSDSSFTLQPWLYKTVYIRCHPQQNILHNTEMLVISDIGNISVNLTAQGKFSNAYYNATENLEEQNLKNAMNTLLATGYVNLGYDLARDKMFMEIDNKKVNGQGAAVNTLECVYTGREAVGYTDRTDCQTNDNFNTEHTWPQSLFSSLEPMRADLFHLFPTDETANNVRSNYPFGEVSSSTWSNGGSLFGGGVFEPRDAHKGNVARAMFYFCIRYQNYGNFLDAQESTLRNWYYQFPPTTIDQKRNDDIALLQHNRNPFIDYPQFLRRITSISANSVAATQNTADVPVATVNFGNASCLSEHFYDYHFVNYGNQNVTFSQLSFSNPSILSFANISGSDTTIGPGESLPLRIRLNCSTPQSVNEHMHVTCSAAGIGAVTIPIVANITTHIPVTPGTTELTVFPNPAGAQINISTGTLPASILIHSQEGKIVRAPFRLTDTRIVVDCSDLAPGTYLGTVMYWNKTEKSVFRFIKN